MAGGVGERLLDNAVDRGFEGRGQPFDGGVHCDGRSGTLRHALGEPFQCWCQPQVIQDGRAEFPGEAPELPLDQVQQAMEFLDGSGTLGCLLDQIVQGNVDRCEELPGLVVQLMGDPPRLFLSGMKNPAGQSAQAVLLCGHPLSQSSILQGHTYQPADGLDQGNLISGQQRLLAADQMKDTQNLLAARHGNDCQMPEPLIPVEVADERCGMLIHVTDDRVLIPNGRRGDLGLG